MAGSGSPSQISWQSGDLTQGCSQDFALGGAVAAPGGAKGGRR